MCYTLFKKLLNPCNIYVPTGIEVKIRNYLPKLPRFIDGGDRL